MMVFTMISYLKIIQENDNSIIILFCILEFLNTKPSPLSKIFKSWFIIVIVNSSGTAQGSTPTSSFYVDVRTKNINSNLVQVGTTKGFNTDNLG